MPEVTVCVSNCLLSLEQMSVYLSVCCAWSKCLCIQLFVEPGANVCVSKCLLCLEQMSVYPTVC